MTEHLKNLQEPSPPQPFEGFTIKATGHCNMGCAECFMYGGKNESQRTRREEISLEVTAQAALRAKEHMGRHGLNSFFVTLHGGEPLLMGLEGIRERAELLRNTIPGEVTLGMQTNGLLLNKKMAKMLADLDFRVGISVDGGREANDRHRVDQAGRSTYDRVLRAIDVAKEAKLKWGLLAVIDLENDPLETYDALEALDPPEGMDFLLPLANWTNPPPPGDGSPAPYADWLIPIVDEYLERRSPRPVKKIRSIMSLLLGGPTYSEVFGNPAPDQVFISHTGKLGDIDTLNSLGSATPDLGMDVFKNSLDDVADHPWMQFRRLGRKALSDTCQGCEFVRTCAGGYVPYRYEQGSGETYIDQFKHPSVYCNDFKKLIGHTQERMRAYLEAPPVNDSPDDYSM